MRPGTLGRVTLNTRVPLAVTPWKLWPLLPGTSCQIRVSPLWVMALPLASTT
ncbi:hypothetical protein D3C78_1331340 [compost metagenome]